MVHHWGSQAAQRLDLNFLGAAEIEQAVTGLFLENHSWPGKRQSTLSINLFVLL
jgi:hypothetical protein